MGDSCCGNSIDVRVLQAGQRRVLVAVLAINLATFVMMVAAALYSGSSSLLSGGLDNLGDALTYALSIAVVGASDRAKARVALLKGALILGAAIVVAVQISWRLAHPSVPIFETIGAAALLNLAANIVCLRLLTQYRHGDVNMGSAWECSRNDVGEGVAVLMAAVGVWWFEAGWPDLLIGAALLLMFLRSGWRVFRAALRELRTIRLRHPVSRSRAGQSDLCGHRRTFRDADARGQECHGETGAETGRSLPVPVPVRFREDRP